MKRKILLLSLIMLITLLYSPAAAAAEETPVRIAIIDTGIRKNHTMLNGENIEQGENYAFPEDDTDDLVGHGTRIAGLILGSTDGTIKGTAPDTVLVPLVYYSRYPSAVPKNGGVEAICHAIYDAVDSYDCQVINISSGVTEPDDRLYEAICYAEKKGIIVISAMGNDNLTNKDCIYYPAAYETVVGVGAANADLTGAADFSQRNAGVLLLAPGENLIVPSIGSGEDFETVSGTSYAAAQVAGLAARLKALYPCMKPSDFRQIISLSCRDLGAPGYDTVTGWGLVDMEVTGTLKQEPLRNK
ncbi:Fervidolysin [bioreactor metagenome]|uniref:Fervidolysin n=1 Tax=bioreactor metagenome TaxID=1076179 RepID=A0A645EIG1_9ZZZZ|nr:S8/S53 family peptidase [Lutispora sp.]MEA4961001.1 S8/S53 family peptidase [Lutispora sp.]